jgi:hypothetical protein
MTNVKLSNDECDILTLGLSFVPTPRPMDSSQLFDQSLLRYFRSIRLRYHYGISIKLKNNDASSSDRLKLKSKKSINHVSNVGVETYIERTQQAFKNIILSSSLRHRNMTYHHRMIMQNMRNHPSIIFKPADKNLGITALTREWYEKEMKRQLNDHHTYERRSFDSFVFMTLNSRLKTLVNRSKILNEKEMMYITQNEIVKSSSCPLYGMPKIHKLKHTIDNNNINVDALIIILQQLVCRPIVSCVSYFTTPLSKWLDWVLRPLVSMIPTVIKDSKSFVNMIESFRVSCDYDKDDCVLLVADITSLYTMIPTKEGITMMKKFICRDENRVMLQQRYPEARFDDIMNFIIDSLTFVLENNFIDFDGDTYRQINGTAMGQSCAVVYANIFVYEIEIDMVNRKKTDGSLLMYGRFIDDVFSIIPRSSLSSSFIQEINSLHRNMQFNCVTSNHEVEFLDVVIFKGERYNRDHIFDVRVHQKHINRYLYIPSSSFHTKFNKIGWIKAELIRYIRNTSSFDDYMAIKLLFYHRLRARGYRPQFLVHIMNSVSWFNRHSMLGPSSSKEPMRGDAPLCFISTLNPAVTHSAIRSALMKNWNELVTTSEIAAVMGHRPIIGYRRPANIANCLVRSRYASRQH